MIEKEKIKAVLLKDLGFSCWKVTGALFLDHKTIVREAREYITSKKSENQSRRGVNNFFFEAVKDDNFHLFYHSSKDAYPFLINTNKPT